MIFNWEYATDPATAAVTSGSYTGVERAEKVDTHAVKLVFGKPQPFWFDAFCGYRGMIIPKHLFEAYRGAKSREAPANVKPVGTGPYKFVEFKPGDVVRAEINPAYHVPNRPFFDTLEMKGGGDATSAARAVLQTGEYDYAWNLQVEDDILRRLEQGGKGRVEIWATGNPEHIQLNQTDPGKEVDGERSSLKTTHPFLTDPAVRQALNLLVDRGAVQEQIYGRGGQTSANFLNSPSRFYSRNTRWEFNVDKANQVLDAGGLEARGRRHPGEGRQSSSRWCSRPRSTPRARRPSRSSSRRRPRPASRWSSSRWWPRSSSRPIPPIRTPTRTSTRTSRCTTPPWARPTRSTS